MDGLRRHAGSTTRARVSESVLARLHIVIRTAAPVLARRRRRRAWRSSSRRRRGRGTTTLADVLRERLRERAAPGCCPGTSARSPRPTRRTSPPRTPRPTSSASSRCPTGASTSGSTSAADAAPGDYRFKVFRAGPPLTLSHVMPVLHDMGVEVSDERPYTLERPGAPDAWVYDFGLRMPGEAVLDERQRRAFEKAFAATWSGRAESDAAQRAGPRRGAALARGRVLRAYAATCARSVRRSATPTWPRPWSATGLWPGSWWTCSRRASTPTRRWSTRRRSPRRSGRPSRPSRASTRTASCGRSSDSCAATLRTSFYRRDADGQRTAAVVQARPVARCPTCRCPARASRSSSTRRGSRACTLRFGSGRARRTALVGPARGLPHRGARPGQGPDGEERRHRAGRVQGRLRGEAARRPERPRGVARRGHRLLHGLRPRAARRHRQHRRRRGRAARRRGASRRRRPLPGRGRRQGDGDLLRHRQRGRHRRNGFWLGRRVRLRRARRATTTRPWASPPAVRGSRSSGTSASSAWTPRASPSPSSASAT